MYHIVANPEDRFSRDVACMVFVRTIQKSPTASQLKGLDPSFEFCCQALTGKKEIDLRLAIDPPPHQGEYCTL